MLVNNIDIKNFKCKLMSRDISSSSIKNNSFWNEGMLLPYIDSDEILSFKKIKLEIDILADSQNDLEICKSNLVNQIKNCIIKFQDSTFLYRCILQGDVTYKYVMPGNEIATITLNGYSYSSEVIETMNNVTSKTIDVGGNTRIPCIVEVTPTYDLIKLTINGLDNDPIIINNLKSKKTIIIDGESCLVTVDGANNFGNMDMWNFPSLKAGSNTITLDQNTVNINIKFKPRYI